MLSLSFTVYAEMVIRLNNAKEHTLAIKATDIALIDFKNKQQTLRGDIVSNKGHNALAIKTYRIGPSSIYKRPSDIEHVLEDGSVVEIEAGVYPEDVAVWRQNNIIFRGIGGQAHLKSNGKAADGKAIWVIKGDNVVIENIEFSGAKVPSRNGAGIRMEGTNLTLRQCYFHDNEMGILTGKNPASEIIIENSEFNNNTVDFKRHKHLGHNIYIGEIGSFTLKGSYIHDAETGHNVKSRAKENYILYNKITDEKLGSSYLLDFPNGGDAFVIGNVFHQNQFNDNYTLVSFSAERGQEKTSSAMYVVNNTFVNSAKDSVFINNHSVGLTTVINNLFVGPGKIIKGVGENSNNIQLSEADFINAADYDYRLKQTMADVINQGVLPGIAKNGFSLTPKYQYVHSAASERRPRNGSIDIGAYEFVQ